MMNTSAAVGSNSKVELDPDQDGLIWIKLDLTAFASHQGTIQSSSICFFSGPEMPG
jgi:hypothetical protein